MDHFDITIIGAGAVGLAVAECLSRDYPDTLVVEKNRSFGRETSSRNSEVIHAGIYYPPDSLKTSSCIEGKELLYAFCQEHAIPHTRIGKLIVARDKEEARDLESLLENGRRNGLTDLHIIDRHELRRIEPNVEALCALVSCSTGILDTHAFMKVLADKYTAQGGQIAYGTEVRGIERHAEGYALYVQDSQKEEFCFSSRMVINCAGLCSDKVAALVGIDKEEYRLKYCKGDYFRVHNNKGKYINRLIYPVPHKKGAGLGIHATLDLAGGLRLGPDDAYVDTIYYDIDPQKREVFYQSARTFLPFIAVDDLQPDTSGMRPKLQGPGEGFRDFLVEEESRNNSPGFVNLLGIESPGLTAALSLARRVKRIVEKK
ncbi:MAG: NAD(P)/FAD-dependent oxidoreductase [Candidatus Omnitrophica bacterium]|nr:NAD(P)/FAD-dependent oxidoreductase [Candidatus Omnitrophota bacterium]